MTVRLVILMSLAVAAAYPTHAQLFGARKPPPPAATPAPPPDPNAWWTDKLPAPAEAADPLGGRRMGRRERMIPVDSGVDPSTYRLWGLTPLQWQLVRGDEAIVEVWVRPARSVRQSVVRITLRRDGKALVQARAGLACCAPAIARRVAFDTELAASQVPALKALKASPLWTAPRDVQVIEGPDIAEGVCIDGTAYDLTLVVAGRARSVRRACDSAAVGQAADVLEPVLRAALGHDPRFDVIYPGGFELAKARVAYRDLLAHGGALKADRKARSQPPGVEPAPDVPSRSEVRRPVVGLRRNLGRDVLRPGGVARCGSPGLGSTGTGWRRARSWRRPGRQRQRRSRRPRWISSANTALSAEWRTSGRPRHSPKRIITPSPRCSRAAGGK